MQTPYDTLKIIPISYKNIHKSYKVLEHLGCIEQTRIQYGKHGAIPYIITDKGRKIVRVIEHLESLG